MMKEILQHCHSFLSSTDPQKEYGITLLESLMTILLISVLFFFAKQAYQSLQITLYEEFTYFEFTQNLKMAKSLASIENRALTLCGTFDGNSCIDANEKEWLGWIFFYDDQATFIPQPDQILHYQSPESLRKRGLYFISTTNIGGGINFRPRREYAYGMARSLPNGRIKLCYNPQTTSKISQPMHYSFIINVYGYFRIEKEKGACK